MAEINSDEIKGKKPLASSVMDYIGVNMNKGLQIGLVNIIKEGGAFGFFPIVNWSF